MKKNLIRKGNSLNSINFSLHIQEALVDSILLFLLYLSKKNILMNLILLLKHSCLYPPKKNYNSLILMPKASEKLYIKSS